MNPDKFLIIFLGRGTVTRTCTGNFWYSEFGDWTGPAGPLGTRTGGLVDWLVFEDLPHPCGLGTLHRPPTFSNIALDPFSRQSAVKRREIAIFGQEGWRRTNPYLLCYEPSRPLATAMGLASPKRRERDAARGQLKLGKPGFTDSCRAHKMALSRLARQLQPKKHYEAVPFSNLWTIETANEPGL